MPAARRSALAAAIAAALGQLAEATEKVIAVPSITDPCPPYNTACANTWTGTANIGDPCFEECQTNVADGTRWCPTTADTSGSDGSPWGWCAKTPEEGEAKSKEFDAAEDDWTIAGSIIGLGLIYVAGGVYYNHRTHGVARLPHPEFWRNIAGLVKDGVVFSRAKYSGDEAALAGIGAGGDGASYGAVASSPHAPTAENVVGVSEVAEEEEPEYVAGEGEDDEEALLSPPVTPSKRKKKKKKKRKKKPEPEEEDEPRE